MTLKKIYLPEQSYFITTNVLNNEWKFGKLEKGIYVPNDKFCQILINDLKFYRSKFQFLLPGYVIMPSHLHLILTTAEDESSATRLRNYSLYRVGENSFSPSKNISQIMKSIKGKSARIINGLLGKSGQLWQHSFYEHCIRNQKDFIEKMNYINFNPFKANLVQDPADFRYSSYRNYYSNDDSIIKIDRFDL